MAVKWSFDGDLPKAHPSSDLFGFDPFAKKLAENINEIKSPCGVVLAITGEWGSGKSTLMNLVKRELSNAQVAPYPAIVEFNPWWFSSREDLAPQMIRALRDRVNRDKFRGEVLSSVLTEYADAISSTAGYVGGAAGKFVVNTALKLLRRLTPNFHRLKQSVARELGSEHQKYVFFIDDIDRLAPNEVVELLRSVKAVGDFPNVVYVLAFDRKVVSDSVAQALSTNGGEYLEKVVQAAFPIPMVDRLTLRKWLFEQLSGLLAPNEDGRFDEVYWSEVYFDGLDVLFRTPRDVVRFINTLSVTYPAVAGEVNVVDFISIEALRLFSPETYEVIRKNPDRFTGEPSQEQGEKETEFHRSLLAASKDGEAIRSVLSRIFPKFGQAHDEYHYPSGHANWRHALRVCHPDIFPTYFQFAVPARIAARSLVSDLKAAASASVAKVISLLRSSAERTDAAGVPQIRDLVDRLADDEEKISVEVASNLLSGVLRVGDEIIILDGGRSAGFFEASIDRRLNWLVSRLVAEIPSPTRAAEVKRAFERGGAIALMVWVIGSIRRVMAKNNPTSKETEAFQGFDLEELIALQEVVADKFCSLSPAEVLKLPSLDIVVYQLLHWGEVNSVRSRIVPLLLSRQLPEVLEKLASISKVQSSSDPVVRKRARLDPRMFERFVDSVWIDALVRSCVDSNDLTEGQRGAVNSFLRARSRLAAGKPMDGYWDDDD